MKMQGHMTPNCLFMVYDQHRRCIINFKADTEPGKIVYKFLKDNPSPYPLQSPYHALQKSFLYAKTEVDGLRVYVDKFAPWQGW